MHYWDEIFHRAWDETKELVSSLFVRIAPAIIAVFLQWWQFGVGSVKSWSILAEFTLSLVEAYGLVFIAIYAWKIVATVPALLRQRDTTIIENTKQIEELTAPRPALIRLVIRFVQLAPSDQKQNVSVLNMNVEIHNGGPATSLKNWRLVSKVYPDVATLTNLIIGDRWRPDLQVVEIGERKVEYGSISFKIKAAKDQIEFAGNEWRLELNDVTGQPYRQALPKTWN